MWVFLKAFGRLYSWTVTFITLVFSTLLNTFLYIKSSSLSVLGFKLQNVFSWRPWAREVLSYIQENIIYFPKAPAVDHQRELLYAPSLCSSANSKDVPGTAICSRGRGHREKYKVVHCSQNSKSFHVGIFITTYVPQSWGSGSACIRQNNLWESAI